MIGGAIDLGSISSNTRRSLPRVILKMLEFLKV
jgi:hypothetical protein